MLSTKTSTLDKINNIFHLEPLSFLYTYSLVLLIIWLPVRGRLIYTVSPCFHTLVSYMPNSEIVAYTYTEIQRATGLDTYHVGASATAAEREDRCLDEATSYGFLSSFESCESREVSLKGTKS